MNIKKPKDKITISGIGQAFLAIVMVNILSFLLSTFMDASEAPIISVVIVYLGYAIWSAKEDNRHWTLEGRKVISRHLIIYRSNYIILAIQKILAFFGINLVVTEYDKVTKYAKDGNGSNKKKHWS